MTNRDFLRQEIEYIVEWIGSRVCGNIESLSYPKATEEMCTRSMDWTTAAVDRAARKPTHPPSENATTIKKNSLVRGTTDQYERRDDKQRVEPEGQDERGYLEEVESDR